MQQTTSAERRSSGQDGIDTLLLLEFLGMAAFCLCVWGGLGVLIWFFL